MLLKDFYSISETKKIETTYISKICINKKHELYNGHFPGRPVTPGVILMQLFQEEAERIVGKPLQLQRADNVKFMAVFDPNDGDELILETNLEEHKNSIKIKGLAKNKRCNILKISALYKII